MSHVPETKDNNQVKRIVPCREGCEECKEDIARYEEIIGKLSGLHLQHETDPGRLCSATFHEFDKTHSEFHLYPKMQGELFEIARRHNLDWAKI